MTITAVINITILYSYTFFFIRYNDLIYTIVENILPETLSNTHNNKKVCLNDYDKKLKSIIITNSYNYNTHQYTFKKSINIL